MSSELGDVERSQKKERDNCCPEQGGLKLIEQGRFPTMTAHRGKPARNRVMKAGI
jgi:hypothetical protein